MVCEIDDFRLPEVIERRSAETLKSEEEQRVCQEEIKRLKETHMILEQHIEQLENDLQSSQLSDSDSDDITQDHLQKLTRNIRTCWQPLAVMTLRMSPCSECSSRVSFKYPYWDSMLIARHVRTE